ncbi:ABC transporter F family member 5 [Nymphaea thermarum]|nr:ABC transporter F family member 5 [Nymphaea thermarum]
MEITCSDTMLQKMEKRGNTREENERERESENKLTCFIANPNLLFKERIGAEALDLEKTVLETVEEVAEDWRIDDIKGLLGRCNFKSDMLDRKVSFLSGGEKARLAFCKFMVKPSTLLVLDEPTNHLDIPSKEMLEEAITEYKGTVITVSHDRYFIRQIVNRVIEVKDGTLQDYAGDYNYYLEKNLEARQRELEREAELEEKAPKVKAKSKMSKPAVKYESTLEDISLGPLAGSPTLEASGTAKRHKIASCTYNNPSLHVRRFNGTGCNPNQIRPVSMSDAHSLPIS